MSVLSGYRDLADELAQGRPKIQQRCASSMHHLIDMVERLSQENRALIAYSRDLSRDVDKGINVLNSVLESDGDEHEKVVNDYLENHQFAEMPTLPMPENLPSLKEWTAKDAASETHFYMQNGVSGNAIMWWAKGRSGYTTDIERAHVFTKEEAIGQHRTRIEDKPWPKGYIDQRLKSFVDSQQCNLKEALRGTGVKISKPERIKRERHNCPECGGFMSEFQYYTGCPQCNWSCSG